MHNLFLDNKKFLETLTDMNSNNCKLKLTPGGGGGGG